MGLNSVVKGIVSQMEKVDTVNPKALEKWRKRAVSIAKDLSQSGDKSQYAMSPSINLRSIDHLPFNRQRAFETAISDMAQTFISAAANETDTITTRLEPEVQSKRADILLRGDEILDSFQVRHLAFILRFLLSDLVMFPSPLPNGIIPNTATRNIVAPFSRTPSSHEDRYAGGRGAVERAPEGAQRC